MARAITEISICAICAVILFWVHANPKPYGSVRADRIASNDLKIACIAQEAFRADHGTYAEKIEDLLGKQQGLYLSKGVSIRVISASKGEYEMVAFHKDSENKLVILGPGGKIEKLPMPKPPEP